MIQDHLVYRKLNRPISEADIQVDDMYFSPVTPDEASLQELMQSLKDWELHRSRYYFHLELDPDNCYDYSNSETHEIDFVVKEALYQKCFYHAYHYFALVLNEEDGFDGLLMETPRYNYKKNTQYHFISPFYASYHSFKHEYQTPLEFASEISDESDIMEIHPKAGSSTRFANDKKESNP